MTCLLGPVRYVSTPVIFRRTFFSIPNSINDQTHRVQKRLNHPKSLIYNIVSDVSEYHQFIPYCEESFINKWDGEQQPIEAGLKVGWKNFDETFVCDLKCLKDEQVIVSDFERFSVCFTNLQAESNTAALFKYLYTEWNIRDSNRPNSCDVELILRYSFHNPLYNSVSSMFSDKVTKVMIKAFEKRAAEIRRKELRVEVH